MTLLLRLFRTAVFAAVGAVAFTQAQDMPDFSNFNGMGNKVCPNFHCTSGQKPVQKARSKFVSHGCSAMGGGGMTMFQPQGEGEEPYAVCCDKWHACYQICGMYKKVCDDDFKKCSEGICATAADPEGCKKSSSINSMMLELGGCQKFNDSQLRACDCVAEKKVEQKRSEAIRSFYKKVAPDSVEKAPQLAAKADSVGKMAGLFKKLVAKYPEAIKKEKDPQTAMMEEMMKEAKEKKDVDDGAEDGDGDGDGSDEYEEL